MKSGQVIWPAVTHNTNVLHNTLKTCRHTCTLGKRLEHTHACSDCCRIHPLETWHESQHWKAMTLCQGKVWLNASVWFNSVCFCVCLRFYCCQGKRVVPGYQSIHQNKYLSVSGGFEQLGACVCTYFHTRCVFFFNRIQMKLRSWQTRWD